MTTKNWREGRNGVFSQTRLKSKEQQLIDSDLSRRVCLDCLRLSCDFFREKHGQPSMTYDLPVNSRRRPATIQQTRKVSCFIQLLLIKNVYTCFCLGKN